MLYGLDVTRATEHINRDTETLITRGLLKAETERVRRRRPDGSSVFETVPRGYSVTEDGLRRVASLTDQLGMDSVNNLHNAHQSAATDLHHMRKFAFVEDALVKLEALKQLAQDEDWSYRHQATIEPYPILSGYVDYTFQRCRDQAKIRKRTWQGKDHAIFNTGLFTPNLERVYGLFEEARAKSKTTGIASRKWSFAGWSKESDGPIRSFAGDPPAHLIDDHVERFPREMRGEDPESQDLRRARLEHSIPRAFLKLEQNYKTAVPQFYWPAGASDDARIQLLLPLYLSSREAYARADLSLVIDPHPSGASYTAATSLPLDWAYNNARLLARQDRDWLDP
jgi:hypothetical protein